MAKARQKRQQTTETTYDRLLRGAAAEFNVHGFGGTDTNRIARRAGFAPQTFYRWFQDKVDIFVKTYERWHRQEFGEIDALVAHGATASRLANVVVDHHKAFLIFRRSLRLLSLENDAIRAARAQSRLKQIAYVRRVNPSIALSDASIAAILLQTERLADALAEGEFEDMGLSNNGGKRALALLIHDLLYSHDVSTPNSRSVKQNADR
jgi:AcrR family transcriptional regulator